MTHRLRVLISTTLAALAVSAAGCGADFDPGSRVTSLRILVVQADKPYAKPGDKVVVNALWFDPTPTRARQWAWVTCVNPASSDVLGCFAKIVQDTQRSGKPPSATIGPDLDAFSYTIDKDVLAGVPPAARQSSLVGFVVIACPGEVRIPTIEKVRGGALPVECVENAGTTKERILPTEEYQLGIKRVFIREKDTNSNPKIVSVSWDGKPWAESEVKEVGACGSDPNRFDECDGPDAHTVSLKVSEDSFEKGKTEFGIDFEEQLITQYYATEGLFENDVKRAVAPDSKWVARNKAKGSTVTMWLVTRDDRGGVSYATRTVKVK